MGKHLDELGSPSLTWRDLWVIVTWLPKDSALRRSQFEVEELLWGLPEHLLAMVVDELRMGNWQRQGKAAAPKPKRVPRPGVSEGQKIGSDPIPISQFEDWWAKG
jgi:hypothetical protein